MFALCVLLLIYSYDLSQLTGVVQAIWLLCQSNLWNFRVIMKLQI